MTNISLIFARSENDVIGKDNALPWSLSGDLRFFKRITTGHTIIMGRKTFDSLGKPLPNRRHIVITHNQDWRAEGVEVVHSLVDAIALASVDEQAFIIGGATIYQQAIESGIADHVYETLVHAEVDGDTFLPFDTKHDWELESVEACQADEKNEFAYTFRIWKRKE